LVGLAPMVSRAIWPYPVPSSFVVGEEAKIRVLAVSANSTIF
jgi:hypothetical protein